MYTKIYTKRINIFLYIVFTLTAIDLHWNLPSSIFIWLQVGERRERTGTAGMYAPTAGTPADRAKFYQPVGEIGRQEAGTEKRQRIGETWTSAGRNGAFG